MKMMKDKDQNHQSSSCRRILALTGVRMTGRVGKNSEFVHPKLDGCPRRLFLRSTNRDAGFLRAGRARGIGCNCRTSGHY